MMAMSVGIVVDDDPQVLRFLSETLRRAGIRVLEAESGHDALRLALASPPDFVVTDLEMPGLDGLALCRRLRESPLTSMVPIVMVTGVAATQADEAITAGCDVVLAKPCPPSVLVATIRQLISGAQAPAAK